MTVKLCELPSLLKRRRQHELEDEFHEFVTGDKWTSVLTDTGAAAVIDGAGGILEIKPSDATVADNDEAYVHSTAECFLFADGKSLIAEAEVKFTEADTNKANILMGLMDGIAADALLDDGAGPKASYSGAVFFKVDGETVWRCEVSDSGTQSTQATAVTAGAAFQVLRIEFVPTGASKAEVRFFINGTLVYKKTDYDYSNATEMAVVFGVKNGADAKHEKLYVDRTHNAQIR